MRNSNTNPVEGANLKELRNPNRKAITRAIFDWNRSRLSKHGCYFTNLGALEILVTKLRLAGANVDQLQRAVASACDNILECPIPHSLRVSTQKHVDILGVGFTVGTGYLYASGKVSIEVSTTYGIQEKFCRVDTLSKVLAR